MSLACACLGPQNGEPCCPCEMKRFKEMSVKELVLDNKYIRFKINNLKFTLCSPDSEIDFELDRNQAYLLMLYLQEHLK